MDGYVSVRHYKIRIGKNNFKKKRNFQGNGGHYLEDCQEKKGRAARSRVGFPEKLGKGGGFTENNGFSRKLVENREF